MDTKFCKSCQQSKPVSEFVKHRGFKDGLHCNCKLCERERVRHRTREKDAKRGGVTISEKECCTCRETKPSGAFYRDKAKKSGLGSCCKVCSDARVAAWVRVHPERRPSSKKDRSSYLAFWQEHTGYDKAAADREWRRVNPERSKCCMAAYRATPKGRAAHNESSHRFRMLRPKATPAWADRQAIIKFYAECPPGYHVDHIVPMRGRNVCGLHVLNNLQYLTPSENSRKGNRHEP